jgi:hypothetical protein
MLLWYEEQFHSRVFEKHLEIIAAVPISLRPLNGVWERHVRFDRDSEHAWVPTEFPSYLSNTMFKTSFRVYPRWAGCKRNKPIKR